MNKNKITMALFLLVSGLGIGLTASTAWADLVEITGIDFDTSKSPNEIQIKGSAPLTFETQENAVDKQVVVEIKDARLANSNLARQLNTSSFESNVVVISPYQVEGQDIVRVVVQLREMKPLTFMADGNGLKADVEGKAFVANPPPDTSTTMAGAGAQAVSPPGADGGVDQPPGPVRSGTFGEVTPGGEASTPRADGTPPAPQDKEKDLLATFLESQESKQYIGKPITLQLKDADVADVFRLIGETSGFNIILGDDVRGKINLSLVDVPWDLALDTVFQTLRLGGRRNGNVLRVATLNALTVEAQETQKAKQAANLAAPRIAKVFPINYADPSQIQPILIAFTAAQAAALAAGSGSTLPASSSSTTPPPGVLVQIDKRTNSIVIQDTVERMDQIKKLIEILDTQTPQVMIEAKVVEVTEGFTRTLSGSLGLGNSQGSFFGSFAGGNPLDPLLGTPPSGLAAASATGGAVKSGALGFGPSVSFLPGVSRLNSVLSMGEAENKSRVISAPRIIVLNKQAASIVQSQPVLLPPTTISSGGGVTQSSFTVAAATLSMSATPTVTNDGGVLLTLSIQRDVPEALATGSGVASRSLSTNVMVESGSTLVVGGIYTQSNKFQASGFPLLRKIPLIGALFGSEGDQNDRTELYFFITPRILNTKEAGLGT